MNSGVKMLQGNDETGAACVAWRIDRPWFAAEWCRLVEGRSGIGLSGLVIGSLGDVPLRIDYAIACDAHWRTRSVRLERWLGGELRRIDLECEDGRWTVQGAEAPGLEGAIDIDLGFSPSTNTLPIRRLGLAVGEEAAIRAAWLRFPAFDVVRAQQSYTRVDDRVYRYASLGYRADLAVDDLGLVTDYDEWKRVGAAISP